MERMRSTPAASVSHGVNPTLVFVHGVLLDRRMWAPLVAEIGPGFRCECPDLPGHGGSPPPVDDSTGYSVDTLTESITKPIERVGSPVDFVGFSLGGFIGLRIAISRPELLRTLILIASSADVEPPAAVRRYRGLLRLASVPVFGAKLANRLLIPELMDRSFIKNHPDLARAIQQGLDANPRSVVRPATEAVLMRAPVLGQIGRISMPTLCIAGEHDHIRPVADLEEIATRIPGATLEIISGARHLVPYTHAEAVAVTIRQFLNRVAGPAS